jgi:beta-xylosidase
MCQEDGSIDPAFARDERGQPYLIWKEDGNSRNLPTQIWAQPLTADLLQVTGQKTELLVNDPKSWEGGVVEAPYILRHSGLFYLFYAGNACCGLACHYAEGVARAEHLLGPWTKDPKNPIIAANGAWRCPGHGTAVESPAGKDYFVYHAYPASGTVYLGRQSVIDSMSWSDDGWPVVNQGRGPGSPDEAVGHTSIKDDFVLSTLSAEWKWPVGHEPEYTVGGGKLTLTVPPQDGRHSFIARSLLTPEYAVSVSVLPGGSAAESLVLIGDAWAGVGLSRREQTLELWQASRTERKILWSQPLSDKGPVTLRVTSTRQGEASFSYRILGGPWMPAGDTVELKSLLPWDSGLRMGLMVDGAPESSGSFAHFEATGADE